MGAPASGDCVAPRVAEGKLCRNSAAAPGCGLRLRTRWPLAPGRAARRVAARRPGSPRLPLLARAPRSRPRRSAAQGGRAMKTPTQTLPPLHLHRHRNRWEQRRPGAPLGAAIAAALPRRRRRHHRTRKQVRRQERAPGGRPRKSRQRPRSAKPKLRRRRRRKRRGRRRRGTLKEQLLPRRHPHPRTPRRKRGCRGVGRQ